MTEGDPLQDTKAGDSIARQMMVQIAQAQIVYDYEIKLDEVVNGTFEDAINPMAAVML